MMLLILILCHKFNFRRQIMNKFIEAIKAIEIASGGMKAVEIEGNEIVICNAEGKFYAIKRRCGHMNSPLEKGTLDGVILTCAMHCAQFDITSGEALSGPVPAYLNEEKPSPKIEKYLRDVDVLMQDIHTHSIRTYQTKVEDGSVMIAL
jgi:nitrite reductase/ring-hydroxylating ferredoxin subunit